MTRAILALTLVLAAPRDPAAPISSAPPRRVLPVLAFPEPGLDDSAAYQGYQTRFYRDSKDNTVQIYLQPQGTRAVLVWADAANESVGFTARDAAGRPAPLGWGAESAEVSSSGALRSVEYRLTAGVSHLEIGGFVLGSMRIERDYVYSKHHLQPFTNPPFRVAEESLLVAAVGRLPSAERRRHLALLNARSMAVLSSRLLPALTQSAATATIRVERPSLDGRNRLLLELTVDPRRVKTRLKSGVVGFETRPGSAVQLRVRVTTDAAPLTPLMRQEIFSSAFLEFLERINADSSGSTYARRLERQVRGVELLSTGEKLMAGLPNFATYFGRDMMMTALMMRPIWTPEMPEHVIASVLRKLGPRGDVSHEEALGGQAIRENAVVYDSLLTGYFGSVRAGRRQKADSLLDRAREVLRALQATRENYHMMDDEFQLPVLVARYLEDSTVPADRRRAFLLKKEGSQTYLSLLLREMALVAAETRPYVQTPRTTNLVGFPRRDATHWRSASWRDSDAGYANGRFAMDINAVWAPTALRAIATILETLPGLGLSSQAIDSLPEIRRSALGPYLRDPASLRRAIEVWNGARRHFEITLAPEEIRQRTRSKLAWLPELERSYWDKVMADHGEVQDSLTFLVLSLDAAGHPIPVVNTDPSTGLFLNGSASPDQVQRELMPFLRPYPVGLFVDGLGPLVANDAYAAPEIWDRFQADQYHGPRVVWGREVNLLLLGVANQIAAASDSSGALKNPAQEPYVRSLKQTLQRTLDAVNASGLQHNELWSYEIKDGRLIPTRYGTSSDVQLWNTTNLVVQYVLSKLR